MKIIHSHVVKAVLLAACAFLSGCALAGLEGPERQAKAQDALRKLPGQVAQLPVAVANDLTPHPASVPATGYSSRYSDLEDQLDEIRDQNDQIQYDLDEIKERQEDAEWERTYEKALGH